MVSRYVSNFALGLGPGNSSAHPPPHVPPMPLGVAMAATAAAAAAAAVVPQQQQQQQQTSQTLKGPNPSDYHVPPCLVQGPSAPPQAQHQHYRILHSRSDGYVAAPSAGFSQSGPPHQAPTVIRGMQSTAPPTPPQQQDLNKMNQPPPQTMYVQGGGANGATNVRQNQQSIFRSGSSASTQRAPRHNIPIQQPYISQPISHMMMQTASYHTPFTAQRQPASQIYPPSQQFQLQQAPLQANFTGYPSYFTSYSVVATQQQRSGGVPTGMVQAGGPTLGGPNTAQQHLPMQSGNMLASIPSTTPTSGTSSLGKSKRRKHAIDIINPVTKQNILDEFELSKSQQNSTTVTPEISYPDSLGQTTADVICGPTHGVPDTNSSVQDHLSPSVNLDQSNTSKNVQGTFIGLMNQHKISAVPPPQPQQPISTTNENLSQTPVVSAMSDGPSVEIPPKQQTSKPKRNKTNEVQQNVEKSIETNDQSASVVLKSGTPTTGANENSMETVENIITNATSLSFTSSAKTVEDIPEKAIKTTISKTNLPLHSLGDTNTRDNYLGNQSNHSKKQISTNTHHNISTSDTTGVSQSQQQKQQQQANNNIAANSNTATNNNSNNSKKDAKSSTASSQLSTLQSSTVTSGGHLSTSLIVNKTNKSTSSQSSSVAIGMSASTTSSSTQATSSTTVATTASTSSTAYKENNKKIASNLMNNNQNNSTTAGGCNKGHRAKDRSHQQQQQMLSNNHNNNNSSNHCNNNSTNNITVTSTTPVIGTGSNSAITSEKIASSSNNNNNNNNSRITTSSNHNNNNNNNNNSNNNNQIKTDKMKLNEKDDNTNTQIITAGNKSNQSSNSVLSATEKNNNKKISDRNDNIIPTKNNQHQQQQKHQRHNHQQQQRQILMKDNQQQTDPVSSIVATDPGSATTSSNKLPTNLLAASNNSISTWSKTDTNSSNQATKSTMTNSVDPSAVAINMNLVQKQFSVDETDAAATITKSNVFEDVNFTTEPITSTIISNCSNNKNNNDSNSTGKDLVLSTSSSDARLLSSNDSKNDVLQNLPEKDNDSEIIADRNNSEVDLLNDNTKEQIPETNALTSNGNSDTSSNTNSYNNSNISSNKKLSSTTASTLPTQDVTSSSSITATIGAASSTSSMPSADDVESSKVLPTTTTPAPTSSIAATITTNGVKCYNREQLLELREAPLSRAKPKVNNNAALGIFQSTVKQSQTSLMPPFARIPSNKRGQSIGNTGLSMGGGSNMSNSSGGGYQLLKQSSMSGVNPKSNAKGSKSGMIHVSLSLREDVKLNETENAWRPAHMKGDDSIPESVRSKDELLRKVRGILNKLTPEKFHTLVEQIMRLQIDTQEKINGVMILVFEKAIDEPNFSVSYARLCQHLAESKLSSEVKKDGKSSADSKASNLVLFKNALLDKTQREFNDNVLDRKAKEMKLKPLMEKLKECADLERKLELQSTLEEQERKIRRRSGGTVRFIGELFKISMLTPKIIRNCIKNLLEPNSEDKLECLCKLLTTVGEKLESTPVQKDSNKCSLDDIFKRMQNIVDRKNESAKISSRVRFMLQDVIDLRKNKWQSKRTDMNPKTMEQIQKEAETEQYSNQFMNYNMPQNKKDDRRYTGVGSSSTNSNNNISGGGSSSGGGGGSGGYFNKNSRQQLSNDGDVWYKQTSKGARVVDTHKLGQICNLDYDNSSKVNEERRLGEPSQFQWNRGKDNNPKPSTTTSNSFAVLSNLDLGRGSNSGPRNKGSYNKGSMERDRYEGRHSRSGSAHGSRENSMSRNSSARGSNMSRTNNHAYGVSNSQTSPRMVKSSGVPSGLSSGPSAAQQAAFNEFNENPYKKLEEIINEMITTALEINLEEAVSLVDKIPEKYRPDFIQIILNSYLHLAKTKEQHRKKAAELVLQLYNKKHLTIDHITKGYEQFSQEVSELIIDVPELWKYVFQFIGPLLYKRVLDVRHLWNDNLVKCKMGKGFLKHLFTYCSQEFGPNYTRELWRNSGLTWKDCLPADDINKFIKDNKFEFIDANDVPAPIYGTPDMNKIMERIKELLKEEQNIDLIIDYITGNIDVIDKQFIRGLTTIVFEHVIQLSDRSAKLDQNKLKSIVKPLLQRYVDSKEEFELECLYAIQVLIYNLEHPSGVLVEIFYSLYDDYVISRDAFAKWRDSREEPAGKGVAVKGLTSFFEELNGDSTDENN